MSSGTERGAAVRYQSGFGNQFATEALPGALPEGRNSPQRRPTGCTPSSSRAPRSPRRGTPTGAAGCIASARRRCTDASRRSTHRAAHQPLRRAARSRRTSCAGDPLPLPRGADRFHRRAADARRQRLARRCMRGCGIHWYVANRSMARALLLRRRRRAADRAAARARCASPPSSGCSRSRRRRSRVIPRGLRFRVELPDGAARAATSARTSARRCGCPTSARSAPTASPIRAISRRRSPGTRTATGDFELVAKFAGELWTARIDTRRSTSSPGTATTRPTSTTCAASTPSAR